MAEYDFSGRALNQRWSLVRRIGAGAFATVYLAQDLRMYKRKVAVKVLNPEHTKNPSNVERFLQEVRVAAKLDGPYRDRVVKIIDQGRCDVAKPPLLFLVMEYVEGITLSALLFTGAGPERRRRALPWPQAVAIVRELCRALDTLHGCGIVHRDIKPGNCILEQRPDGDYLKLLDLGIVKVLPAAEISGDHPRTHPEFVLGTPRYMAPEQFGGPCSDPRVDLYAAGIMLYEFLTGDLPSRWYEKPGAAHPYLPIPPSDANPDGGIPPQLDALALKAVAFEPDRRFQSAAEFAEALSQILLLAERVVQPSGTPTPQRVAPHAERPRGAVQSLAPASAEPPGGVWLALRWWVVATTTCTMMVFVFAFAAVLRRAESRPTLDLEHDDGSSAPVERPRAAKADGRPAASASASPAATETASSRSTAASSGSAAPDASPGSTTPPASTPSTSPWPTTPPVSTPAASPGSTPLPASTPAASPGATTPPASAAPRPPAAASGEEAPRRPAKTKSTPTPAPAGGDDLMPIWPNTVDGVERLAQRTLRKLCADARPHAAVDVAVTVDPTSARVVRVDVPLPGADPLRACILRHQARLFQFAGLTARQTRYSFRLEP